MEKLENAIKDGSKTRILEILQRENINLNMVNENGDTVLHLVLQNFHLLQSETIIEQLDIFINRGADPNIKNKKQETLLHLAIKKWNREVINYLLQYNANVNAIDDQGNSIAHFFVTTVSERQFSEVESVKLLECLLEKGLDFDLQNHKGQSALHLAIEYNSQHILLCLLKHTRDIHFVCKYSNQTLLQLFLSASIAGKASQSQNSNHSFFRKNKYQCYDFKRKIQSPAFSRRYDIEIVRILLERGVSVHHVDNQDLTALHLAVEAVEEMDIVELLLDQFTKIQDECGLSLARSVIKNQSEYHLKILNTLIMAKGLDVNKKDKSGSTPLYYAIKLKNFRAIELMKEKNADFNVVTNLGDNMLHALAEIDPKDETNQDLLNQLFDFLVSKGCDVNARNNKGETPLHVAVDNENTIVVQKLIAHGVDVNCRKQVNEKVETAFHSAMLKGNTSLVKLLIDNGANVNCKSEWYGRPLHVAISLCNKLLLKILLRHNAKVNARDSQKNSAIYKAILANQVDNVRELLSYGADINDPCVTELLKYFGKENRAVEKFVLQHWTKLKVAELPRSNAYEALVQHTDFTEKCLREVDELKNTYIDSQTSLYKWLHIDPNRRYVHNRNAKLRILIVSPTFVQQFPEYSTVILGCYRDTETRRRLLEPAKKAWLKLTEVELPDICIEHILAYLNTGYLFEIVEAAHETVNGQS